MPKLKRYKFQGIVRSFGKIISQNWCAETMAISKAKATVNIQFQYKRAHNMKVFTNIEIDRKSLKEGI